ncbi:DUF1570 domain-containing protein [Sphingomonas sp. CJ99]
MTRWLIGLLILVGAPGTALAEWHEASTPRIVVYAEGREQVARELAEQLERFDAAIRLLRGMAPSDPGPVNRLNVYVVGTDDQMARLAGGNRNVGGFYVPRAGHSMIFVPRSRAFSDQTDYAQTVLFHEYAHHLMFRETTGAVPGWFSEGFAEFFATARMERDGSVVIGWPAQMRANGLMRVKQIPLEWVLDRGDRKMTPEQIDQFYGLAWLLTHYLSFSEPRKGQLAAYLAAINSGSRSLDAAKAVFGDLKQLDKELDRYRMQKLAGYRVNASMIRPGAVTTRRMTDGEAALIDLHMESARGVNEKTAAELLPRVRKAAAGHSGDAWAQTALAEAEFDAGNLAEALAAAERAVAIDPKQRRGHIYVAMVKLAQAADASDAEPLIKQGRAALVRANRLDPDDPVPMMMIYQSAGLVGTPPHPSVIEALHYAHRLAPEDQSLRWMSAAEYVRSGKLPEAATLLGPLANDPHAPADNRAARVLKVVETGDAEAARKALEAPEPGAEGAAEKADAAEKGGDPT